MTVISPAPLGEGASSVWAQGGIAASVGEGDTPEAHAADTIAAGAGLVDEEVAHTIAREAREAISDLLSYGVPFDRDLKGHFVLSREAAHSAHRVVRVSGDRAGHAIMQAVIAAVRKTQSIRVLEGYSATGLLSDGSGVRAVEVERPDWAVGKGDGAAGAACDIPAAAVVLATGGVGSLFEATTNPAYSLGQGIGMAARLGAVIADAEFVQYHPTALKVDERPNPLASEALRGEGAKLVAADGRSFMADVHPLGDLAPRDVVARAVYEQDKKGGAFLDCRHIAGPGFAEHFQTFNEACGRHGLDPKRDLIPVTPAAHYHMGGVATDLRGRSSVSGLWVIGEVASTGLHGANRLASNSLIEATVMADRAARDLCALFEGKVLGTDRQAGFIKKQAMRPEATKNEQLDVISDWLKDAVGAIGVVRNGADLREALSRLQPSFAPEVDRWSDELICLATMLASAYWRDHSVGAHYRSDAPDLPAMPPRRSFVTLDEVRELVMDLRDDNDASMTSSDSIGKARA